MFTKKLGFTFLIIYAVLGGIAIFFQPSWWIDTVVTLFSVTMLLVLRRPLQLDTWDFIMINGILLIHNAGFFGLYAKEFIFGYDTYAHFVNSALVTVVSYRVLERKSSLSSLAIALLSLCVALSFGVLIELIEYAGGLIVAVQNPRIGLGGTGADAAAYGDTIKDLFANMLGAVVALGIKKVK
jgi:uncharacterized membrane protein YjdF